VPTLWFVVPAAGRAQLAAICLRQLRRTCDALGEHGIEASAVVIADDENIETAEALGFATVRRNNNFLAAKFNDGIQAATDAKFNPRPVDYVIPCGSDDFVDYRIFLNGLPGPNQILAFKQAAFVSEDGRQIASRVLGYAGGVGIRVYPRALMELVGFRPAEEDRKRACDTSILVAVDRAYRRATQGQAVEIVYGDVHPYQVVDWKSGSEQLNSFADIVAIHHRGKDDRDPWSTLDGIYPREALREMHRHYVRPTR
jgi:hypothetical protein